MATTDEDLAYLEAMVAARDAAGSGATSAVEPAPNRWTVSTLGEVADFLNVEAQTVREWRSGRNAMPGREGQWDLQEIVQWRCNRLKANAVNAKPAEILELERRELELDVAKKALAHQMKSGELVERTAVKATLADILNRARTDIEQIPSELGPSIPADLRSELVHQMTQKLGLILRKMSQQRSVA